MTVAWVANHRRNGCFIFRPGWIGLGIDLVGGFGGAAGLLVGCWRPVQTPAE